MSRVYEFYDFGETQEYCVTYFPQPFYKKMYTVVMFLLYYCFPLLFIAMCYFLMAKNLRAHVKPGNQRSAAAKGNKIKHHHPKGRRRLSKLVLAVVTVCCLLATYSLCTSRDRLLHTNHVIHTVCDKNYCPFFLICQ